MTCYLDPSVMLPILIKEPASAAVDAFMSTVQQELWVSDFAAAEVASAVSRLVCTGRLQATDGAASLSDFDVWRAAITRPAEIHAVDVRLAGAYVRRFDLALRAPDALHLRLPDASMSRWSHSIDEWRRPQGSSAWRSRCRRAAERADGRDNRRDT